MRIGFFVWEYPPRLIGGLGTYPEYITRDLVKMGSDVVVFTLNPGQLKTSEVIHGVDVHRPLNVDASSVLRLFVGNELQSWGDQLRFFSSIFTNDILCTSKMLNSLIRKDGVKFDMICVHDWLGGMAASIVKAEEDLVNHGWGSEKIFVVWNGVDPEVYSPKAVSTSEVKALRAKYGIKDGETMILFVGRLNWVKGIINLVQAMPAIAKEYPKAKLVILGTGDEEANIRNLIKRLGIEKNVICRFEFVPEHERIVHYAACDIGAFPSVYEPFGIVSLEAMALEKPILVGAKGVSGLREQVVSSEPGQTGIHVDGSSSTDIAWGLRQILSSPQKAKEWGRNARQRVIDYFTWEKAARQTMDVYEGLVESYQRGSRK